MKFLFLFALFTCATAHGVTLEEAFQSALKNEEVRAVEAQIIQSEERINQVKGGLFPDVSLTGAITRQEDDEVFRRGFGQRTQKSLQLQLVQPLFQGFKEFAALRLAKADSARSRLLLEQAKLNLYQSLAELFYGIISTEVEIKLTQELAKLSKERVGYLERRVKVGRSRKSELISAQAQLVSVSASIAELQSSLTRQREAFGLVTGLEIATKLEDGFAPKKPRQLDSYLSKLDGSPWLQARDYELESATEAVSVAKANHWPSLELRGNYYFERGGSLQGVNWDVGVALTMPIYSGGSDSAAINEAVAKKYEVSLRRDYEKRRLYSDVRATHTALEQGLSQLNGFEEAVKLNRRNYDELNREYGLGLVTNLDVINALNQYVQSQRDLNRVRVGNYKDSAKLKALTGEVL